MRSIHVCFLFAVAAAFAQATGAGEAASTIPTPRDVLGFDIGERPAAYHEVVTYMTALDAASDRVELGSYGETSTGRKQLLLTISTPANLARLDNVQRKLAQLGAAPDESVARRLIAQLPAVAWMGYSIHGDEISGVDAAMEIAYRLAQGKDPATLQILDNLVVYLDPMANPDGRERNLAHLATFSRRLPGTDLQDMLHNQLWPSGRGNHYLFDLNRDAMYTVQPEARARVAAIVGAHAQFLADAHEMRANSTHLFAVPAEPFNPNVPPEVHATWRDFAAKHAEAFDRDGISYYTRSWNEVFYPGYFDILLAYHGGTPMIYEQASNAGTVLRLPNGRERTYAQSVANHVRSSWADLTTAAASKDELLRRWWSARKAAASGGKSARTWFILPTDAYKLTRLVRMLRTQAVQIDRLEGPGSASELHSIWGRTKKALPAGTLCIRGAQPLGNLVRNIFDFHVPMAEDFLERERRGLDLRQETLLYDTTAWSVAHAFDADIYWSAGSPGGDWVELAPDAAVVAVPSAVADARYGYLYRDASLEVTARLLAQGVNIRVATRRFVHNGAQYAPGDLLIRNDDQTQNIGEVLRAEQAASNTAFVAADSARITDGPDLGADDFHLLKEPRIAILAGSGTDEASAGALWYLFDGETGIAATLLDRAGISGMDLSRYNVLVLPDSDVAQTVDALNAGNLETLQQWVRSGGTLIALRGGARALVEAGKFATRPRQAVIDDYPPLMLGRAARDVISEDFIRAAGASAADSAPQNAARQSASWTYPVIGEAARAFVPDRARAFVFPQQPATLDEWLKEVPGAGGLKNTAGDLVRRYLPQGAYMRVDLKPGHWLSYGASQKIPVMFREDEVLVAENGADLAGRYAAPRELALSGLIWPEAVGYVADTAYMVREELGAGQIVLFANDPVFRGYSLGTQRLFMNAAILGPAFR